MAYAKLKKTSTHQRGVIYARYSTDMQREESIEGQVKACTELAEKDGIKIVNIYIDRAMTGKNDNRPQFQQMIKDGQAGLFDTLYVWKVDRFGRNRYEIILNKQKLKNKKISIRYAKEHIPETKEGIILESMLEGMAEYYSANLSENVSMGMERNAEKCYYNGGNIPLGYRVENKHFILDEVYAPVIKRIFREYVDGKRATDIANTLQLEGYNNYGRMNILRIIKNERYTGKYIYTLNGEKIIIEDGLPRIISDELFQQAQEERAMRKTYPQAGARVVINSFTGKMKCGYCGATVSITSTKKYGGVGHYHYYRCTNRSSCKEKPYIKRETIDSFIFSFLYSELLTEENIKSLSLKAEELQKQSSQDTNVKTKQKDIEKKINNITTAIENGHFSQSLSDRLKILESELEEIKIKAATVPQKTILKAKDIEVFLYGFLGGNIKDEHFQKKLSRTFVESIEIKKGLAKVTFNLGGISEVKTFVL